jgi:hypothetical protein
VPATLQLGDERAVELDHREPQSNAGQQGSHSLSATGADNGQADPGVDEGEVERLGVRNAGVRD